MLRQPGAQKRDLAFLRRDDPCRELPEHRVTVEDVRQLMGASTPHFALQLRNRIRKLIRGLPADDPARVLGEREIAMAMLERIAEAQPAPAAVPVQDAAEASPAAVALMPSTYWSMARSDSPK